MNTLRIVTHNGDFHTDDVFATAIVILALGEGKKIDIVRTRDEEEIARADVVLDVGGVYDEQTRRFDHHQEGGAGARANGIPFASVGLVWKAFGVQLSGNDDVAARIDTRLIMPIDANDNGVNIYDSLVDDVLPYTLQDLISVFRATWKEDSVGINDSAFLELVEYAQKIITREILVATHAQEAEHLVEADYERAEDKRLVVLSAKYPWNDVLMRHPEPLYVVYQDDVSDSWRLKCVRAEGEVFKNRKSLPQAWAGKRGEDLARVTGVPDARFCHNKCFLATASSKEGALALARIALEN